MEHIIKQLLIKVNSFTIKHKSILINFITIAWPFTITIKEFKAEQHYENTERWPVRGSHLQYEDKDISFARLYIQEYFTNLNKILFVQSDGKEKKKNQSKKISKKYLFKKSDYQERCK